MEMKFNKYDLEESKKLLNQAIHERHDRDQLATLLLAIIDRKKKSCQIPSLKLPKAVLSNQQLYNTLNNCVNSLTA